MIRDLILGEAEEQQPSFPEEEIADHHPLAEPDWDQSSTEQEIVQTAEAIVQNSPPESTLGLGIAVGHGPESVQFLPIPIF